MARTRPVVVALPLICILIGLAAMMVGHGRLPGKSGEPVVGEDKSDFGDREFAAEPLTSSEGSFLDDLSLGRTEAKGEGSASVFWVGPSDLPTAAEGVLRKYERVPDARLITSGYLDANGNVWGAVVRGGTTWCDLILVSTEDDEESTVRVARLAPGNLG